jgi:glycosyltransferase involved in cell wall biosynthesis
MSTATVVIAATGNPELSQALNSALAQDFPDTRVWVVIDGPEFESRVKAITDTIDDHRLSVMTLPENTGGGGFYGHRIYAAASHLINSDFVCWLDQDNWMEPHHVRSLVELIEGRNWQWAHSLRKIYDKDGTFIMNDDCESLGRWPVFFSTDQYLVDTSTFCFRREVIQQIGSAWHFGWGGDRRFLSIIRQHFKEWGTTGRYSLNYRLDGNENSVNKDFFVDGLKVMEEKYGRPFPWRASVAQGGDPE